MRMALVLLMALLLVACQQPGTAISPSSSQLSGGGIQDFGVGHADGHMRYFKSEGDAMTARLALALLEGCYGKIQAQDKSGLKSCMRDRTTTAFDDSGEGRGACDRYSELDAYAECVLVGNMVLDIRHRLDDDSPVASDFWTGKDAMIHAMVKSLVIGAATNCASGTTESEIVTCATDWFSKRLGLPSEYTTRCSALGDDDRGACLGEAETLQYMRTHIYRISKDTI